MPSTNGNLVKAFGIVGLVIGVLGGAWGLASSVGPKVELQQHDKRIDENAARIAGEDVRLATVERRFDAHEAAQVEALKNINEKLDLLLKAVR